MSTNDFPDVSIYRISSSSLVQDSELKAFEGEVAALLEGSTPISLGIDFSRTFFVSSRALGLLVATRKKVVERGGRIVLFGVNPAIRKVMQVTQVDTLIPITGGEAQAIQLLRDGGPL